MQILSERALIAASPGHGPGEISRCNDLLVVGLTARYDGQIFDSDILC